MLRNPAERGIRQAARLARVERLEAEDVARGNVDDESGQKAGENDGSGAWKGFGQLDRTPLTAGDGFRLA